MGQMTEAYTAADANGDGLLDAEEFRTFQGTLNEAAKKRGEWIDESSTDKWYAVANKISEANGITMAEVMAVFGVSFAKHKELKAAHDAK